VNGWNITVHLDFFQGLEVIAEGLQRWSADYAALRIEQLRLCSELNCFMERLASHYAQWLCCITAMACSSTD